METKTQLRIMQFFTSRITGAFSIRQVAKELKMHHALAYRAFRGLIKDNLVTHEGERYALNYKGNHQELSYFEHLRSKEFVGKPRNKKIGMLAEDVIRKFPYGYFVLLIFGSAVTSAKPRDIDILVIIEKTEDIETAEKAFRNIARNYTLKLHVIVLSFESAEEMLSTRDDGNVMNQVLDNHLILSGPELFYKIVKRGRR